MLFFSFGFSQNQIPTFESSESQHVFLLGNLETLPANSPVFSQFEKIINSVDGEKLLLFNGDFIDENGIDKSPNKSEKKKIERLLTLANLTNETIFVPGDREWDDGGKDGFKKVKALEKYFKKNKKTKVHFTPSNACLGPEIIDVGDFLRIVSINTQWWVHPHKRSEEEDLGCPSFNEVEFWDELESAIEDADNRNVIVAGHHPILSFGKYAGYGLIKEQLLPPVIGSFVAGYHQSVGSKRDLAQEELTHFSKEFLKRLERFPQVIYTSGHEYDLQVNFTNGSYHLNSGAIAKTERTGKGRQTQFRKSKQGFIQLEFLPNGSVKTKIWTIQSNGQFQITREQLLYQSPCEDDFSNEKIPINEQFNPCFILENFVAPDIPEFGKSFAGKQFQAGKLKNFFMGKHYRKTWAAEIDNVPFLNLDSLFGGLTPTSKGGGAQTVSLKFTSADGQRLVFRPLEKFPNKRLDQELKNTIYGDVLEDFTAHQHPYASLAVGHFMDILGLPHSQPKLFLMPNHPRLGIFRKEFAGKFGFLEIKPKSKKKGRKAFQNADKVVSTFQMYRKLLGDNDNDFDIEKYVTARIFDMWISDWDRHQDNWKWLGYDNGKGMTYTPFPKDRDKAFSLFQGLYQLMDWELVNKDRGRFRESYRSIKSLNFKARNMDRILANEYDLEEWMNAVDRFTEQMTDEVIANAMLKMPPEIQELSSPEIIRILKVRRSKLKKAVSDYYKLLSKKITIVGTNDREVFDVFRMKNNEVRIQVFKKTKKGKRGRLIFNRIFKPSETKEINLFGLRKKDEFYIGGRSDASIKIRIIGGDGKDLIVDKSRIAKGNGKTIIYDFNKKDSIIVGSKTKLARQNRTMLFHAEGFYNDDYSYFVPFASFNVDDRWGIGFATGKTWQRFGKPDFGIKYSLTAQAFTNKNYRFNLNTQFREVVKKWDLVLGIFASRPDNDLRFFYGLGNETSFNRNFFRENYYTNTTTNLGGKIGLRRTFWQKSELYFGAKQEFRNIGISSRNKTNSSIYGDLVLDGFGRTNLLGAEISFNLDLRDDTAFPTRGAQFKFQNFSFANLMDEEALGGRTDVEALFYFTVGLKIPTTLGLRTGFSTTHLSTPFFYKSYIGQQSNLRGFRKNRFGGSSSAFINTDLRFHFGTLLTRVLPLRYGVYGLFDVGRVWENEEDSDIWHYSYGGGIYLVPYVESFNLNLSLAKPNQGKALLNFKIGFFVR